jgi:hypothetical protein
MLPEKLNRPSYKVNKTNSTYKLKLTRLKQIYFIKKKDIGAYEPWKM